VDCIARPINYTAVDYLIEEGRLDSYLLLLHTIL